MKDICFYCHNELQYEDNQEMVLCNHCRQWMKVIYFGKEQKKQEELRKNLDKYKDEMLEMQSEKTEALKEKEESERLLQETLTELDTILDKQADGSLVLISKYGVDCKQYNETLTSVTWEKCTLRKWLNEGFYNTAFSAEERTKIVSKKNVNDSNYDYGTWGGKDTYDKVWLLSINEVRDRSKGKKVYSYFSGNRALYCDPTPYTVAQGARVQDGHCDWWLRSPGRASSIAAYIATNGQVQIAGNEVYCGYVSVRPVIIILP